MEITLEILATLVLLLHMAGLLMPTAAAFVDLPALLAAGVPPTQALATNKLQSSFGSFSASWYFVRNGIVSIKEMRLAIFVLLLFCTMPS